MAPQMKDNQMQSLLCRLAQISQVELSLLTNEVAVVSARRWDRRSRELSANRVRDPFS